MEKQIYMGIDISSSTLDICIKKTDQYESVVIENTVKSIQKFLKPYAKDQLIIGMENTGRYNWNLYQVLGNTSHRVFVISPLHLKRSIGLIRGKNDKVDAIRINVFVEKNHTELKVWKAPSESIQKLKVLLTERNFRIKNKRQVVSQRTDYSKMKPLGLDKGLLRMNKQLIDGLNKQIKELENQITELINSDELLKKQAELMKSIPGVGNVLCWTMLAKTEGFTLINDPRKMACYSGVVPFDNQSGTSLRGRPRVSIYADKSVKSILHLAAMSAIRLKNDLQQYYQRKVSEGKNKMSVLNAVRNKIIHRIFSVIQNQKMYEFNLNLS